MKPSHNQLSDAVHNAMLYREVQRRIKKGDHAALPLSQPKIVELPPPRAYLKKAST